MLDIADLIFTVAAHLCLKDIVIKNGFVERKVCTVTDSKLGQSLNDDCALPVRARDLWFFPMYSYEPEDKSNKFSLTYMEQFSLGSQFKEAFPFPLGSRFFKMR
jgi:hypothetical protein